MQQKDKQSSTGKIGGGFPNPKRRMTIARYHRDMADDYRKHKIPRDRYEELAQKHEAEAQRYENIVHQVLRGEREE